MNHLLKKIFKGSVLPLVATRFNQPVFQIMHRCSLIGMNIGGGSDVEDSGELAMLRYAANRLGNKSGLVAFDIGANMGNWTLAASRILAGGTIFHCFEPSPVTRQILVRNLAGLRTATVHPHGAGATAETLTLFRPEASGCASLYQRGSHALLAGQPMTKESVSILRIDEVCSQLGISKIDFLKFDIEGHEIAALRGCGELVTKELIGFIQFEFGGCNIDSRTYFHDFWQMLNPGYRIYRVLPRTLWEITQYHETLEQFTTTNFLAVSRKLA